jgi:hypothetical protein
MTQEGSSRRRARSSASPAPGTRRGEETATAAARRKRFSNREDLFRNQDPQEKMRLNLQYRELQKNADRG